jgi:MoxR-like ATPase
MSRSATASPKVTPKTHSTARRPWRPVVSPREMNAAIGATNGCSWSKTRAARDHAALAAVAVCRIGHRPPLTRRVPAPNLRQSPRPNHR